MRKRASHGRRRRRSHVVISLAPAMKRRTFLLAGLGATGALVLGWGLLPPRQRITPSAPLPPHDGEVPLNGWLAIGTDGHVTAYVPKAEMGQGIHTALAMVIAEELDADWATMRVAHTGIDRIYNNVATIVDGLPFHPDDDGVIRRTMAWLTAKSMREVGVMMTGGSSSVKDCWEPMRLAAATARAQLVQTAARAWKADASDCTTANGVVRHRDGRTIGYGALVASATPLASPGTVALKAPRDFRLIGTAQPRIERGDKARGRATFAIDVRPAGMLHAAIVHAPVLGGHATRVDDTKARAMPGVRAVTIVPPLRGSTGGVAIIATSHWQARQALAALDVTWDDGPAATISSADVTRALETAVAADDGFAYHSVGDATAALDGAATRLDATYRAPYLAHVTMEPMNCTVVVRDDGAECWAGTQVPGLARDAIASVLGIDAARVVLHEQYLGGGFGRRLETDVIAQAAHVARAVRGTPVQLVWSREEDTRHDFYRPACVARFRAGLDAQGQLTAWLAHSASQSVVRAYARRHFDIGLPGIDKTQSEGSYDLRYEVPSVRVTHTHVDLPIPVGFWRAVGHSHQAFFTESFVDEAAHAARRDPVDFRRVLLANHPRQRAVLERVARESGWGTPTSPAPDGAPVARGVALHTSFGTTVGQVVELSIGPDRRPRVHRVTCALDCGIAVNPNHIAQQVESGVVFGLAAALNGEVTIDTGRVREGNFDTIRPLRLPEIPVVAVHVLESAGHPEGLGEPGLPPVAPAVANALFALTGVRLRTLPLRLPDSVPLPVTPAAT
ncbi:MAG: molybdopterin-dependent oxidoreductase [Gemmatimonadaceae bacterium]|nr:molybdopterin-dependent oxidoreductase [Gemmatimonadaceae bacterium]